MRNQDELAYDISVCVHSDAIAAEQAIVWATRPISLRPLRRLEDGALRSGIVEIAQGWSSDVPLRVAAQQQFAVLSGKLTIGEAPLGPGAFVVVRAGAVMPPLTATEPTVMILIQDERQAYEVAGDIEQTDEDNGIIVVPDVNAIEPFTPIIDGVPLHGFERRVLWLDPESGADTRLLRIPAGFSGAGANWHPVNEEIFCLEGDIQPDATRPMRAGSFLWNPARSIHGFDERTEGGCVLLEWHDGPWALTRAQNSNRT